MGNKRADIHGDTDELKAPDSKDFRAYEVFVQLERHKRHAHAGSVDAADDEMALQFAREHYGQDQPCVNIWVVEREHIIKTDYASDLIWRHTDQSYRLSRGYNAVAKKWQQFRKDKDIKVYQKDDIKRHF